MAVIVAFILNAGLNFGLGLLLAKLMGPADFGLFGLATTGAVVLNTLVFEWLRLSATRFYSNRVRREEPWIRHGWTGPTPSWPSSYWSHRLSAPSSARLWK